MAQIHSATFPVNRPLWDEEVVPALRKRLESESRTLAKRMSAVSLSSEDDYFVSDPTPTTNYPTARDAIASPLFQSSSSASARSQYQKSDARASLDRTLASNSRAMPNGSAATKRKAQSPDPAPAFQRSRTYSQPYLSEPSNGQTTRQKANGSARPTRIPLPTGRSPPSLAISTNSSIAPPPIPNGYHQYTPTIISPPQDMYYEQSSVYPDNNPRTPIAIPRGNPNSSSNVSAGLGLLHEPPPFNPASSSSSVTPSFDSRHDDPPRPSMESEERPFEHWYRGEVSRNGGVGELRVGRRQEMLEIANYGHTIRAKERERREDGRRRKRADSMSRMMGMGDGGRERGSLYLDEEHARDVGMMMDEAPLTDLEVSDEGYYDETYGGYQNVWEREEEDRFDQDGMVRSQSMFDGKPPTPPTPSVSRNSNDTRSTTPTPSTIQAQQRPNSRNTNAPPSKIPSRSRQPDESRVTTPTPTHIVADRVRGSSEPPPTPSASTPNFTPSPPQTRQRQQSKPTPAGRATRALANKATRAKTLASKKELEEEAKRRSVAYYPTPGEDGDETMIDAIPEWTQPVPKQGNWDDVVLPVVARKKGLEEHYEKADGNPTPRKPYPVAPAPGTFGYDHTKYRPPQKGEPEIIPMDEFGRPTYQNAPETMAEHEVLSPNSPNPTAVPSSHEQTRLPLRTARSPAPFADYAPTQVAEKVTVGTGDVEQGPNQMLPEEKEDDTGCCRCIIM